MRSSYRIYTITSLCLSLGVALEARASDPSRLWSTYYGGSAADTSSDVVFDRFDDIVHVGRADSSSGIAGSVGSPATAYDTVQNGGQDGYVTKFTPHGSRVWGTYYGGAGLDYFERVAIDDLNSVVAFGSTTSSSGISTLAGNSLGGTYDGMLVKFNQNGGVTWGRYFGGNGNDFGYGVCIGVAGSIYVVGQTTSTTGLARFAYHQPTRAGTADAFIAKIDTTAGTVDWATYFGGSDGVTAARGCAVDQNENIYVAGETSASVGISEDGWDNSYNGGTDAFLAVFNTSGQRQWATYYGGAGLDRAWAVDVNSGGYSYLAGTTKSPNTASQLVATDGSSLQGNQDGFVVAFRPDRSRRWGAYVGGVDQNHGLGDQLFDVDVQGTTLLLSGSSDSAGNATPDAYQTTYSDAGDALFMVMDQVDGDVIYSTYLSGVSGSADHGFGVAGTFGNAAVSGTTTGAGMASAGAWDTTFNAGGIDSFLTMIRLFAV